VPPRPVTAPRTELDWHTGRTERPCLVIEQVFYDADDDVLQHTVTVNYSGHPTRSGTSPHPRTSHNVNGAGPVPPPSRRSEERSSPRHPAAKASVMP
jgi:hypothetical protein